MEDKSATPEVPKTMELTHEEKLQRQYDQAVREIKIANARSHVVKGDITEAYRILERIRFDHIGDTAFRDKVTKAKKSLEDALEDFLLSDSYWARRKEQMRDMTAEEYELSLRASSGDENEIQMGVTL